MASPKLVPRTDSGDCRSNDIQLLTTSTYIDPVCGASASFVQRLSEMASLEGETMRHENLKKLKKTKRLES
ncbi:hypothetical protein JZ751_003951 [Albula glossodonta]|uniref:Uncharacterized protein n=1 Tax=Albula glossodonta TaxID=121402 RepID=A0A8T2P5X8_9TELE|nr:hypothetical protein JZ751_003951 [Albula glossodonta]